MVRDSALASRRMIVWLYEGGGGGLCAHVGQCAHLPRVCGVARGIRLGGGHHDRRNIGGEGDAPKAAEHGDQSPPGRGMCRGIGMHGIHDALREVQ